jgi:hypothetical protein
LTGPRSRHRITLAPTQRPVNIPLVPASGERVTTATRTKGVLAIGWLCEHSEDKGHDEDGNWIHMDVGVLQKVHTFWWRNTTGGKHLVERGKAVSARKCSWSKEVPGRI